MLKGLYPIQFRERLGASAVPSLVVWRQLQERYSVLQPWNTAEELLAFLRASNKEFNAKSRVFRALLQEHHREPKGVALGFLLRIMTPSLLRFHSCFSRELPDPDELMGRIILAFCETVDQAPWSSLRFPILYLRAYTHRRLCQSLASERLQRQAEELLFREVELLQRSAQGVSAIRSFLEYCMGAGSGSYGEITPGTWSLWLESWIDEGYLSEEEAYLIRRWLIRGSSTAEIARILGLTEAAVRQRKHRLLERLSQIAAKVSLSRGREEEALQ